mmetsp:Transcript_89647/g.238134  ORF Transcript_89647/g.238134 Transcript_89647/m.238134 type:complete len:240 (-) Transcript_89647:540-1259(-)
MRPKSLPSENQSSFLQSSAAFCNSTTGPSMAARSAEWGSFSCTRVDPKDASAAPSISTSSSPMPHLPRLVGVSSVMVAMRSGKTSSSSPSEARSWRAKYSNVFISAGRKRPMLSLTHLWRSMRTSNCVGSSASVTMKEPMPSKPSSAGADKRGLPEVMSTSKPLPKKPSSRPAVKLTIASTDGSPSGNLAIDVFERSTLRHAFPMLSPKCPILPALKASPASASSRTMSAPFACRWPET